MQTYHQTVLKLTSAKEEILRCFFIASNFSRSSDNCKSSKGQQITVTTASINSLVCASALIKVNEADGPLRVWIALTTCQFLFSVLSENTPNDLKNPAIKPPHKPPGDTQLYFCRLLFCCFMCVHVESQNNSWLCVW